MVVINNDIVSAGGTVKILDGTITGVGTIGGDINNTDGAISPGANSVQVTSIVPEPPTAALFALGPAGCPLVRRRTRSIS